MRFAIIGFGLGMLVAHANATCIGGPAMASCYDGNGNTYTVQRFGNITTMYGSNPNTWSQWSQTSTRMGNTTFTNGMTNGRSWYETQTPYGAFGTDSNGNPFSCIGCR